MKTSLLALCTTLACLGTSGAHAQSHVKLAGLVDAYAGSMRMAGDAGRTNVLGSGGMTTSWFGFSGSEDLGGGLKANFLLTSFQRVDTGTPGRFANDPFFSRDASVGLSGGFGSMLLGRGMAPNFLPTIMFNPFGDSFTFSPLVLLKNVGLFNGTGWTTTTPADTGWSNQITYTSPKFGGLVANLHYQFGEQTGTNDNRRNVGLNAIWTSGPFGLTGYYERDQIANPVNGLLTAGTPPRPDTRKDWMLGGSYDAGVAKGFLTYGESKSEVTQREAKTTSVGASAPIGAGKLLASIARADITAGPARTIATVGYDYFLSKRTDLYANLMRDRLTGFRSGNSFGIGVRHRF
ncbi:porin [uncultured Xylophilus sp.]|uniref:porin n=1 Tax=uncultured Xylophilus sp. TaxID=296832 RepID=UPI0026007467|nr:porin [uncultured Xylophilus sp.]